MVGSVIPGVRQDVTTRLVNYMDFSTEAKLKQTKKPVNPLISVPPMNGPHSAGTSIMEKLKSLLAGGKNAPPHIDGPQLREGYQEVRENRDWRKM